MCLNAIRVVVAAFGLSLAGCTSSAATPAESSAPSPTVPQRESTSSGAGAFQDMRVTGGASALAADAGKGSTVEAGRGGQAAMAASESDVSIPPLMAGAAPTPTGGMSGTPAPALAVAGAGGSAPMAPASEPSCPAVTPKIGESSATLMQGGVMRSFLIYTPSSYDNTKALPLVLNFHGGGQYAAQQQSFAKMNPKADASGFIVVYPEGIDGTWDAGACCSSSPADDVGFTRLIVDYMKAHFCVDPRRIYSTGMSNGGRMTYRLGCEAADIIAAIAPVAGIKSFPDLDNTPGCKPARPIALMDFQGTADRSHIRYQAGQIEEWVAFNGCTDAKPEETYRMGDHYCSTYSQCQNGTAVTFCVVPDGGHCWPGSYPCPLGDTSMPEELSANELMWEFFSKHAL